MPMELMIGCASPAKSAALRRRNAAVRFMGQVLIQWEKPLPSRAARSPGAWPVRAQAELERHEIGVAELDARERRNARSRLGEKIGHGKADACHGRDVVKIKRSRGRRGGDVRGARDERIERARLEITRRQRGDG